MKVQIKGQYSKEQIEKAISRMNRHLAANNQGKITGYTITEANETTSDHQPCQDCGGIFFLRTGTCHVCQTCGASQGCS